MTTRYNLNRLTYFIATVEEGSITAAANSLGISKAVVSKQLQLLEEEVGVNLFMRNTRRIRPTQAGQSFYTEGKAALVCANEAFENILEHDSLPKGKIRVTAPVDYGLAYVAPLVAQFRNEYPTVSIHLDLRDEQVDIIDQGYDLAFRVGWLNDSSNLARKLQEFQEIVVCSPTAVKQASIRRPEDLHKLSFIANHNLKSPNLWIFQRMDEIQKLEIKAALSINITMAIKEAVINGNSFAILPDFLVKKELHEGKLIRLLPKWSLRTGGIYTLSPSGRRRTKALRSFLEMVNRTIS